MLIAHNAMLSAQTFYQYKANDATICFFDKSQSQYIPHIMRKYETGKALHKQIWGSIPSQSPFMMFTDWDDDGNAGVTAIPHTIIQIGVAPLNTSYFVSSSNERFDHLFKHEYTHVVMTDKSNSADARWRNFTGNKVVVNSDYPISALWSYLDTPRWYAPRWYQEGIACFMETWLGDGAGRALGGYDETYFRTQIMDGKDLFSIVGLETEGSTSDFQQGTTSYLYGTRFINYLVLNYGYNKVIEFYNRTEDSAASYAKQFERIFGKNLRTAWNEWIEFEKIHQQTNLSRIAEYPLTELHELIGKNLGSASPMIVDEENHCIYLATNAPGDFSKIVRIPLDEGGRIGRKIERLAYIDGPMMYQTTYLAYDKKGQRLIWTDRNGSIRGLVVYDITKKAIVKQLKNQRIYEICYDNTNGCLYGLLSNQGAYHLIRYDSDFKNLESLFSFPFGISVSNLDVSHDGTKIAASMLGSNGEHSLIMFDLEELENANSVYETLYTLPDANLSQFRFSYDDSKLVGFSYYTGVPNIWQYNLESGDLDLLSNVQTGMFAPYLASNGLVYAYHFSVDGMSPVTMDYKILHDANSVEFLGQKAYVANPELSEISSLKEELPQISFGEVYDSITVYKPLKELKFQGAYPDISGFTDRTAWNRITPVLGYHLSFYDPLSLLSINLFLGASPWSNNEWKNRFHAKAEVKYYGLKFQAAWNPSNFYDLFGPRRSSRKGYNVSISYDAKHTSQAPFTWEWGGGLAHYGDMDALPLYQEIEIEEGISSFQTLSLYIDGGKTRTSIGGISAERGYRFSASGYSYLASGKFFPSIDISGDLGTLLPFGHNNSFWLKGAVGQAFGDSKSALGNSYFGGFRNNYVDNGVVNRFNTVYAIPGAHIDQICAHNYAKVTGELDFCPIRFNNFGALQCYPNYIQFCLFGHDLMTDWWGPERTANKANYISAGAQMNIQMVFFTHMKTTLSLGYARAWGNGLNQGEFMVSLKLL